MSPTTGLSQEGTPAVADSPAAQAPTVTVKAGIDRVVVLGGKTYLRGRVQGSEAAGNVVPALKISWSKESGPGDVTFENATSAVTTATFSALGDYTLRLHAGQGDTDDTARHLILCM